VVVCIARPEVAHIVTPVPKKSGEKKKRGESRSATPGVGPLGKKKKKKKKKKKPGALAAVRGGKGTSVAGGKKTQRRRRTLSRSLEMETEVPLTLPRQRTGEKKKRAWQPWLWGARDPAAKPYRLTRDGEKEGKLRPGTRGN